MTSHYLLLLARGPEPVPDPIVSKVSRATGLGRTLALPGMVLLATGACRSIHVGECGVLVGTLFRRGGAARPAESLAPAEAEWILESGGRALLSSWWGGYVFARVRGGGACVLRDPSGALPCWFAARERLVAFASDARLLVAGGFASGEIEWPAVTRGLLGGGLPARETGLRGVEELLPGFSYAWPAAASSTSWSPWDHVDPDPRPSHDPSGLLRETVRHCVSGWSATTRRPLVSVSGGLDSSIVAASLAGVGSDASCLTMYGEDALGDERRYARALCGHLALPLVEERDSLEEVDIGVPPAPHLPRPSGFSHALSYERAHLRVAGELGCDAFVTGNGGDAVFGYSQSAAAIADRYLVEGLGAGLATTLAAVCRQTGCSAAQAVTSAMAILRRGRRYRWASTPLFLDQGVVAAAPPDEAAHPWLEAPPSALPGKAAHVASILRMLPCLQPGRSSILPVLNPLIAQPVVELCLSIPSWEWRAGGRDRALARRAFASMLPPLVVQRRVKGSPDGFSARVVSGLRDEIRDRLLGGRLAGAGLLDRQAIAGVLEEDRPMSGEERVRILQLTAAEAWAAHWAGVQREPLGV